jgi:beta-phosphoglucomutase-like phosphatase (HAD superfamily)
VIPDFDLVIFDCDGVLIDSEIISARMLIAELALLGVDIDLDYVARNFLGRSYPTVMAQIRQEFRLELTGLTGRTLGRVYTASQVARGKPAPDLFLLAAAEMGQAPSRTLVIEDSLTGVRAALAAGMTVWRFAGGSHFRQAAGGPETPADLPLHRQFDDFAAFFHSAPSLRRRA